MARGPAVALRPVLDAPSSSAPVESPYLPSSTCTPRLGGPGSPTLSPGAGQPHPESPAPVQGCPLLVMVNDTFLSSSSWLYNSHLNVSN